MNADTQTSTQQSSLFIDGRFRDSESEAEISIANPSTGRYLLTLPSGCKLDADAAVASARRAFEAGWSTSPPSFRKSILHRFADLIATSARDLDLLDAEEMGKPIGTEYANASWASGLMRFYAESVDKITGDVFGSDAHSFVSQRRAPRGVVAAIIPWNFPTANAVLKLAPALAAGNCIVLKPSEQSSRSALLLARLAMDAGLPPGVFNVVLGLGKISGRALALHHGVDMLAFTGSTTVGKQMLQYSGQSNMKVVLAECGGKSPHIVFGDGVDLDTVTDSIAALLLVNQGQLCVVGSRLLVQRSIQDAILEKIDYHIKKHTIVGDATKVETTFGPLSSAQHCERVQHHIEAAVGDGIRVVSGGHRIMQDSGGYFIEPTVFRDVPNNSRIFQDEVFGPVLSVTPFDSEDEAIRLANDTIYGLAAFVWTKNLSTGMRMAKSIRSSVQINAANPLGEGPGYAYSAEPVGQSGIGTEGGLAGLESYLRRHTIWFNHE